MSIHPLDIQLPPGSLLFDQLPVFPLGVKFAGVRCGKLPGVYLNM